MANNFIVKDAGSANVTIKTIDTGTGHASFHAITDPANNVATVKAASTAPLATDTALVVAITPIKLQYL
jgi:hypothetical protein